jgi:hypothetical protein
LVVQLFEQNKAPFTKIESWSMASPTSSSTLIIFDPLQLTAKLQHNTLPNDVYEFAFAIEELATDCAANAKHLATIIVQAHVALGRPEVWPVALVAKQRDVGQAACGPHGRGGWFSDWLVVGFGG